jgi:hypothetical protein
MSEADQFWQYAKEATLSACYAQNGKDRCSAVSNIAQKCMEPKITVHV